MCDRCGAEHAVVYEVLDDETGKHYSVGSSCSKKQFGFEITRDKEAKALVKATKEAEADELEDARQAAVAQSAVEIADAVSHLSIPEPIADTVRYPGSVAWRVGDAMYLAAHGRTDSEASELARRGWIENRIRELVPKEWSKIEVRLYPNERSRTTISMARKVEMLALAQVR